MVTMKQVGLNIARPAMSPAYRRKGRHGDNGSRRPHHILTDRTGHPQFRGISNRPALTPTADAYSLIGKPSNT